MRAVFVLLVLLLSSTSFAQAEADKITARELFFEARDALAERDYERAAELFDRSNEIFHAPTTALGLARSLVGLGNLVRAHGVYATILTLDLPEDANEAFRSAVSEARAEQTALEPRLAAVILHVDGPTDLTIQLDGQEVSAAVLGLRRFVDPGARTIQVTADGFAPAKRTVTLDEGQVLNVRIPLFRLGPPPPAPTVPPSSAGEPRASLDALETAGVTLGVLGVGALIASAISGGLYVKERATARDACDEASPGMFLCATSNGVDAASAARTLGIVNVVTLSVGVVTSGVGITLFAVGGEPATPAVGFRVGPGTFTFRGLF